MITVKQWKNLVLGTASDVADKDFQEATWLGNDNGLFSTPDEVYAKLLDDSIFEEFLDSEQIGLSDEQRAKGKALVAKMDEFSEKMGGKLVARELLASPDWEDVRATARAFVAALNDENI